MLVWKEVREYRPPSPALKRVYEHLEKMGGPSDWPPMLDKDMTMRLPRRIFLIFFEEWIKDVGLQKRLEQLT